MVYGPDRGQVLERAEQLAAVSVADPGDPFSVTELAADVLQAEPSRLTDEVSALTLNGSRRMVRLRNVDAGAAERLAEALPEIDPASCFLLVEAGELAARDRLRKLFEAADNALAFPCYLDEGADLERLIESALRGHGLRPDSAAIAYLCQNLGGDRLVTRGELEKLALYKSGDDQVVTLADAQACVGDGAPYLLDDVVMATASGDQRALDRALGRCFEVGESSIAILRVAGRHFQPGILSYGWSLLASPEAQRC